MREKTIQNNFPRYLKFYASAPAIFSQMQRSSKIFNIMITLI